MDTNESVVVMSAVEPCGCMIKRENGVVVQAITCKFHREL
jgi:hypothetical protein